MNEVLQQYIKIVPVIKDALGLDIMMSITDGYEFLAYWPGQKMVADIHVGDSLNHDDPMWTSFTTGQKIEQVCPATVYGFEFRAITIGIKDGKDIVGTMGIAISMENETFTRETSSKLLDTINSIESEMNKENDFNTTLEDCSSSIKAAADSIVNNMNEVQKFTQDIMKISGNTNMLALNASIEAARSGEAGRGFAVVAEQMRKLANDTKVSSEEILNILNKFSDDIKAMQDSLKQQEETQDLQKDSLQSVFDNISNMEAMTKEVIEHLK